MPARYAVGIDLGTTHTVVAEARLDGANATVRVFPVPQLVTPSEVEPRALFPSMLYAPIEGEATADPFGDAPWALGELARRRGAEVAGRLVASSKSWLVHSGVDRTAPILPWGAGGGAPDDVPKISPVDAAARLLAHVARVWDAAHAEHAGHDGATLAEQDVVLTIPASFDEVARELSVEAARRAGLSPKLLEEPQAAFYDWMATRPGGAGASAKADSLVLVVDVGGGTTDLSLIRAPRFGDAPRGAFGDGSDERSRVASRDATRVAVGPHLLLGGDNMDLALAHLCEPRLAPQDGKLAAPLFAQLTAACRAAKEVLLGHAAPDAVPVTVQSRGSALVGGTLTTRLTREETERTTLDGFFPVVTADARPTRGGSALVAFGLPYQRDVAITKHVAAFLARHLPERTFPDAVLFNGGVFRAARIAERMLEVLSSWRGEAVERLPDADPDLAVARGAVAYALARRGVGPRIGGGSARGYFIGVADHAGAAQQAVCVVPRGAEEGVMHVAADRTLALAVGRPARFELFASDTVSTQAGAIVDIDEERFARLPPIAARIDAAGEAGDAPNVNAAKSAAEVRVVLEGELTEAGTVELCCVEQEAPAPRRFRLAFQLRGDASHRASSGPPPRPSSAPRPSSPVSAPARPLESAFAVVERAFGKPLSDAGGREAKDLVRELERALGDRTQWTTAQNRGLFDALAVNARARRRSADHERVFWLLAGWCIRPGFGDPADAERVARLVALFDERLAFPAEARGWQQFFIAWRRAAAGMDEAAQTRVRDFVDPHLAPAGVAKKPKKPALSLDDALDMAASLERIAPARRSALGGWVLERTWTDRDPRLWAAVGKLGARIPTYASVHHVVAPDVAERWLDHLLREKWESVATAAPAAVALARRTGDRARDIGERTRREVLDRLARVHAPEEQLLAVREVVAATEKERAAFFGDALPLGLRLVT